MRKITTAITAAALAFSMFAAAVPAAAAVAGYDSAYAGESAFVNIVAGETKNFQVFFANTGTTTWVKGTSTQVDLAACLEDKVTCNAQDPTEATWNSGWLSAVRYSSTTQTSTPPGSLGTFSYNITAPTGVSAGIFHFNGDLVLASSGERIHPEGYFQDANTGASAGAATITSFDNNTGSSSGGQTRVINGSGIVCTPTFPTVSFGGNNAVVTSCGSSAVTVTTPAHAPGNVTVTLTNPGAGPSNGLTFIYQDTTRPKFDSFTVSGSLVTVTFSEPVCRTLASTNPSADWTVNNVSGGGAGDPVTGDGIPLCNAARDNGVTTATLTLTTAMPNGAFVETTLNAVGGTTNNTSIVDAAGNAASAPQSRQATATAPETTAPTVTSAQGNVGSTVITLTFSEPVRCDAGNTPAIYSLTDFNSATTDPTINSVGTTNGCGTPNNSNDPTTADTSFSLDLGASLPADRQYTITITPGTDDIQDIVGNDLANPTTITFTTGAGDFTPPTIVDARITANGGTSDFTEANDAFTLTFSEAMTDTDEVGTIALQDQDGTTLTLDCAAAATGCVWNTAKTTVTVTLVTTTAANPNGTTPGMQIPFNITTLSGTSFTDTQGNAVNVLGSADRLVDFE